MGRRYDDASIWMANETMKNHSVAYSEILYFFGLKQFVFPLSWNVSGFPEEENIPPLHQPVDEEKESQLNHTTIKIYTSNGFSNLPNTKNIHEHPEAQLINNFKKNELNIFEILDAIVGESNNLAQQYLYRINIVVWCWPSTRETPWTAGLPPLPTPFTLNALHTTATHKKIP